ncbi:hypothetical protein [Pseudomonas sp. PLMAX]|uniref:hypothetical protein n=1 Tax=Pseudomonas sp. PLMAX TaxID=2201998 RepID=UPI0038BAF3F3
MPYAIAEEQEPKPKQRSTIHRVANKLRDEVEAAQHVYWPAKRLATWNREDLETVSKRSGVCGMMRDGELCWHLEP